MMRSCASSSLNSAFFPLDVGGGVKPSLEDCQLEERTPPGNLLSLLTLDSFGTNLLDLSLAAPADVAVGGATDSAPPASLAGAPGSLLEPEPFSLFQGSSPVLTTQAVTLITTSPDDGAMAPDPIILLPPGENTLPNPLPNPLPAPLPDPLPSPIPNPEPVPTPVPDPTPVPSPIPDPIPEPVPTPVPEPIPSPIPYPIPGPVPVPIPIPVPVPIPGPIPDPDPGAPQMVWIVATKPAADEHGPVDGKFTVYRAGPAEALAAPLTVHYTLGGSTATNGEDFDYLPGTVVIAAGAYSAAIMVHPIQDQIEEGDETVFATVLEDPGYQPVAPYSAVVTIADDYDPPVIAYADAYTYQPDQTLTVLPDGFLGNDAVAEGRTLAATVVDLPQHGTLVAYEGGDGGFRYTPNPGYQGEDSFTYYATDGYTTSNLATVLLHDNKLDGGIVIVRSDGADLSYERAHGEGGWVVLNNDNDNYELTPVPANRPPDQQPRQPKLDLSKRDRAVAGENDLIAIKVLGLSDPTKGGKYFLDYTSGFLSVWRSETKDGQLIASGGTGNSDLDATQSTILWVEAVGLTAARQNLTLKWYDPANGQTVAQAKVVDQVRFNVYSLEGAGNVPGQAVHTYKSSRRTGTWQAPENGTVVATTADTQKIQWGEGPVVGKVVYRPAEGFQVAREVNVVKVTLGTASMNIATVGNNPVPPTPDPSNPLLIHSANPNTIPFARRATAVFQELTGPMVNGQMRGVVFMEVGFIQNITITQHEVIFNTQANGGVRRFRVTPSFAGKTYLDTVRLNGQTRNPWYNSGTPLAITRLANPAYQAFTQDVTQTNVLLDMGDRPGYEVIYLGPYDQNGNPIGTNPYRIGQLVVGNAIYYLSQANVKWEFNLYVAVHSFDAKGLEGYVQKAVGQWSFNGSGTFTFPNPINNQAPTWQAIQRTTGNTAGQFQLQSVDLVQAGQALLEPPTFNVEATRIRGNGGAWTRARI